MTAQFQCDTSGEVHIPGADPRIHWTWSDLSPGVQGCIAAMLEELVRALHSEGCKFGVRAFPDGKLRAPGFSDLHPDTLARIIADWERWEAWARDHAIAVLNAPGAGESLWRQRNSGWKAWPQWADVLGELFPPLTPYLDDKMRLKAA